MDETQGQYLETSIDLDLDIEDEDQETVAPTDAADQSGETTRMQQLFGKGQGFMGTKLLDYSDGGFIYDSKGPVNFYKPGGDFQKVTSAPALGLLDTATDAVNLISPKGIPDIPKVPEYEEKQVEALRDISGLVIPSLALRGMALNAATKYHASGKAYPWLQKLGNNKSFAFFSERGVDFFTGGIVDYTAKQNEKNSTLADQIVEWWPKTDMWVPDYLKTGPDSTADQIRLANVLEGGIFNTLASVAEGFTYIKANGQSVKRTARFINPDGSDSAKLNKAFTDEFDEIKFSDNVVEDKVLRNQARKENALNQLGEYYVSKETLPTTPTVGLHDVFNASEDLVIPAKENGLLKSMVNAAEIRNNIDSAWGRLSAIVTEAGRKNGIELNNLVDRTLVSEVTNKLKGYKNFAYKTNQGKIITEKLIKEAGDHLAATLLHPRVDKSDILAMLDEFKRSVDGSAVRLTGTRGINKAIKLLKQQIIDLDTQKARAYLVTSEAGQISDIAEGARLMEGSESVHRSIELMADRLEVLMVEKGLANFEANSMLQNIDAWKAAAKTGDQNIMNAAAETILADHGSRLTEIIPKAKQWSGALKGISANNPDFVKPFLLASELADGNVDSLWKLHSWSQENLGTWHKLVRDANPQTPSIINKAVLSNLFNSVLSAPTTPIAAGIGNLTGLLGKSQAQIWGAALSGDFVKAKQAMVTWYSLDDTLSKATDHMRLVFRKVANSPKEYSYMTRGDIAIKETKELTALRAYADAASANGEDGAKGLLQIFDDLEAMATDPTLRFGSNAMSGLDGFSKSILGTTEAKYRALWKASKEGTEFTPEAYKQAYNEIYDGFFDSRGMLVDDAIDASSREIALNADSPVVTHLNSLIRDYPILRSVIWFPRTTANSLDVLQKWSPGGAFSTDWHELWGAGGWKSIDDFTDEQIAAHLTKRGRPVDEFYRETFETLRYEVKGKAAISGSMLTLAVLAGMNDRCTGTGHVNKAIQRSRNDKGWKKKSCTSPFDGKQYSYEWMGPIGDWVSMALDVVDNADTLTTGQSEEFMQKLWIIGANNFSDKRVLTQLEPMFDIFQGNGAAANRWASNMLNNALPLGGMRNWLGKTMYPELRELRSEFNESLRNRNAWLDAFDPTNALPTVVDPIDGNPVRGNQSWYQRFVNNVVKVGDKISPLNQWLIDIEYPITPSMNLSNRGALLEPAEQTAINSIIGKQGYYRDKLKKIKQKADNLTYTDPYTGITYKGFRQILRAARSGNVSSEVLDIKQYRGIFTEITSAYNNAKRYAEASLADGNKAERLMYANIQAREYRLLNKKYNNKTGNLDALYEDEYNTPFKATLEMFK